MARAKKQTTAGKKKAVMDPNGPTVDTVEHKAHQRPVIPTIGHAPTKVEEVAPKIYQYDPHLDPQLEWAGKAEHDEVQVPCYALHQHEAVNPLRILKSTLFDAEAEKVPEQLDLFGISDRTRRRLREDEVFAYDHTMAWTNRMIAGDSLLVMNSLLERESLGGKVQCVYMDPPYGIKFGSNFMPNINKRDVRDGKDEDLSAEPEMIRAFRDTWELGIHSYLTYLRDRLQIIRELLTESGSCFVQISIENVHRVRLIMDEVFGPENCVSMITYATTSGNDSGALDRAGDYIVWYAKDKTKLKYHDLYKEKVFGGEGSSAYKKLEFADGTRMSISEWEKKNKRKVEFANLKQLGWRVYALDNLTSQGKASIPQPFEYQGKTFTPGNANHRKPNYPEGMMRLASANRIEVSSKGGINYVRYFDDFPYMPITNQWTDTLGQNQVGPEGKVYVVQTAKKVIERCLLMTTEPGDLVLDPTCGSGTTAVVAEQWGRRWITMDTSRIALALAKRRLMTQCFDWYTLADPEKGVDGGLVYEQVPHVMLSTIANGEEPILETLWDRPKVEKKKVRVTGPFTVEALPSPVVEPLEMDAPDTGMAQAGNKRQQWLAQLKQAGIRVPGGDKLRFKSLEVSSDLQWFCARGEMEDGAQAVVCLGSESAPLSPAIVDNALDECTLMHPCPQVVIFAAFQFDAEAARLIRESKMAGGTQLFQVQMNVDLQMDDLLRHQRGDDSFILVGQPDVQLTKEDKLYKVSVNGFDYYDPTKGEVSSGGPERIAMWMLDTNYDGRCINPQQVFFPKSDVWEQIGKHLKGTIDPERFQAYVGVESLPFLPGANCKVAVKIIDDRGYESLRVFPIKEGVVL